MSLAKNGSIAVRLNDTNSGFFRPGKGLRQGILYHPCFSTWLLVSSLGYLLKQQKRLYYRSRDFFMPKRGHQLAIC
jgi:hypothetical protein